MTNLNHLTKELGLAYQGWKSEEKQKEKLRKEFFNAATEDWKKKTLARKTIRVEAKSEEEARDIAATYNSKWKILEAHHSPLKNFDWDITLEEDPDYKDFVFINPHDGYVYTKSISDAGAIVDIERLQQENPEFWEEISFIPEPERELRPLEDLSEKQIKHLQQYSYKPKPQVKLLKPRLATEEELHVQNN